MSDDVKNFPRVLVVSHEAFSTNTSMGRTLTSYFKGWDPDCLAQLYIHSEVPNSIVCKRYYRYSDVDALKSLVLRGHVGHVLTEEDVDVNRPDSVDTGAFKGIYYYGSQKKPVTYLLRDLLWKLSTWHSGHLNKWLKEFGPELVFFAAGDYVFSNEIAVTIADEFDIPLITCCMDDYYLYNFNENSYLGRLRQEQFMRSVRKLLHRSSVVFTISELMAESYSEQFRIDCKVLYTPSSFIKQESVDLKKGMSYLGGLGYNRNIQLAEIGSVLKEISDQNIPDHIDVYSGSNSPDLLACFSEENGVLFHGSVSADEVNRIISRSEVVVHTESFDEQNRQLVRFSVSTKIPDCLASGTCILAYGPKEVASIKYLDDHDAAFVAGSKEELKKCIFDLFHNTELREKKIKNALSLAYRNHDGKLIPEYVRKVLSEEVTAYHSRRS